MMIFDCSMPEAQDFDPIGFNPVLDDNGTFDKRSNI